MSLSAESFGGWIHKLVFLLMAFLMFMIFYRWYTRKQAVQEKLHSLRWPLPMALQWYSILFMGLVVLMGWDVMSMLNCTLLTDNSYLAMAGESQDENMRIPDWLQEMAFFSPFVACVSMCLLLGHVAIIVKRVVKLNRDGLTTHQATPYRPALRQDMVLVVTVMPAIYLIMSVRSTVRMLYIMSGVDEGSYATVDHALYTENMSLADFCQYFVVFTFSQCCMEFIADRRNEEMSFAIRFAGFLGVYAFVVAGCAKSVFTFLNVFIDAHFHDFHVEYEDKFNSLSSHIGIVFTVMMFLCIINMTVICKLQSVKNHLGKANLKFLGTRAMLVIGRLQHQFLAKIAKGTLSYLNILDLSEERADLLHTTLLAYECLVVILFNYYAWEVDVDSTMYYAKDSSYSRMEGP